MDKLGLLLVGVLLYPFFAALITGFRSSQRIDELEKKVAALQETASLHRGAESTGRAEAQVDVPIIVPAPAVPTPAPIMASKDEQPRPPGAFSIPPTQS